MTLISTFCSSRCVAKLCRSVCGDTRLAIPAARAAAETARQSCRVDIGLTGSSPGNSQPLGGATCHQSRSNSSSCGESMTKRSFCPLPCSTRSSMRSRSIIRDLQPDHLGYAQTGPIGHAERHLVFDAWGGGQKSRNFLGAQHDRRPARLPNQNQTPDKIVPFERHLEKEPKRENGGVDARRTHTALRHM